MRLDCGGSGKLAAGGHISLKAALNGYVILYLAASLRHSIS